MGHPVYATWLANLRGPDGAQGPKGRAGTFDSATAVSVPASTPPAAIISGPNGENVEFHIPQGAPGVNAVPADEAIGTYVDTVGSDSRTAVAAAVDADGGAAMADTGSALSSAAQELFPVYRVWDEIALAYPARIPSAKNLFFGPVDPGLDMDPVVDVWEPGDATSLPAVVAAMSDTGSDLFAAAQFAAAANRVTLTLNPAGVSSLERVSVGAAPNRMFGWKLPDGVSSVLFGVSTVPLQWTNVRIRVRWTHTLTGGTGNARVFCDIASYAVGAAPSAGIHLETSQGVPEVGVPRETVFSGTNPVVPGQGLAIAFGRLGSLGSDSFTGDIVILDVTMERQA